jgi:transposase
VVGKTLVPDPDEQAAIALIFDKHAKGCSLREIIAALDEQAAASPRCTTRTPGRNSSAALRKDD